MAQRPKTARGSDEDGKRLFLRPSAQLHDYLDQVVALGLYGSNPTEAAMSMMRRGIEDLVQRGLVKPNN